MIRIAFFIITNLAVVCALSLFLLFTHMSSHSIYVLVFSSMILGFTGSIISLLMSKWIAINSMGGKILKYPINEIEKWLTNKIKQQSELIGIKTPQILIYDSNDVNAFATGPNRNSSLIGLSTGLIKNMKSSEIEAVIAHEISHISNGDMVTMVLLQGIVNTFVIFISRFITHLVSGLIYGFNKSENSTLIKVMSYIMCTTMEIIFGILATIITMWFSRKREFYADEGSSKIVGKEKMIAALIRLKKFVPQKSNNLMSAFYINGDMKSIFSKLFMSHPSIERRISNLNKKK
ncbi:protease HtpX [Buchnera aphidicola (Taiwanaphis decaspermi)]|uniref:protease HtpX n=1 Tax=Buchnera aphidicola TaxID=9 RepID=UPI0031B8B030